MSEQKSIKIN